MPGEKGFYRYSRVKDKEGAKEEEVPETFVEENEFISTIYNDHVERFLYSHKLSESMLRTQWPHYLTTL